MESKTDDIESLKKKYLISHKSRNSKVVNNSTSCSWLGAYTCVDGEEQAVCQVMWLDKVSCLVWGIVPEWDSTLKVTI